MSYNIDDPIAAIATARAPSALAIIRTSGEQSIQLVARVFSGKQKLLSAKSHTMLFGKIVKEGKPLDEVLLCLYRAPKSFTGENSVEIICHGGLAVVQSIFQLLLKNGFREAERGEFSFRAFINGKIDLTKAEAIAEIIDAKTDYTRSLAIGRLSGNLFEVIDALKLQLINVIAAIDVEVEYPEDEQTVAFAFDDTELSNVIAGVEQLCDNWRAQKTFREGARIVLAGRTNAGKSALFNALLKEDRAIVSDIPGTTRDWLEAEVDINGIPVLLIDIAGFREDVDDIEAIGLERGRELINMADLVLYLVDAQNPLISEYEAFLKDHNTPALLVYSKADLLAKEQAHSEDGYYVSAKTGAGIGELLSAIFRALTSADSPPISLAPGTERQKRALELALESLMLARIRIQDGFPADTVLPDLEFALENLGEITGEVRPDDILDSVFSNFCVGK